MWCAYIEKHGSLNIGTRIEQSAAIVATVSANVAGNKRKVTDFMPHYKPAKSEKVLSLEEAFGALKAVANEPKIMRLRKDK